MPDPFSLAGKVIAKVLNFNVITWDDGSGAVEIEAVFDEETEVVEDEIITTTPALYAHQTSFGDARPASEQKITIDGDKWKIEDVMPDGPDAFTLTLKKDRSL